MVDEDLFVRGGSGDVELCVGSADPCLLVEGHPAILVWSSTPRAPASEDTCERWLLRARDVSPILQRGPRLQLTERGLRIDQPLAAQLAPLTQRLVDGRYTVRVERTASVHRDGSVADLRPAASGLLMEWIGLHRAAGDDALLLGGMPREFVDLDLVLRLRRQILEGDRPCVVLLTSAGADVSFVIAGHEALEAYALADRPPVLVILTSLTPRRLTDDQHASLVHEAVQWCAALTEAHWRARQVAPVVAG